AEIRSVTERRESRVAENQVEAHREHREDEDLRQQPELVGRERPRQRDQEHGADHREPAGHRAPNNPVGLSARMMAIGAKIVNIARPGKRTLPNVSSRPTSRPPNSAPLRLPRPPMMTTTKARSRISKSAPG